MFFDNTRKHRARVLSAKSPDEARIAAQPLVESVHKPKSAEALVTLLRERVFDFDFAREIATLVFEHHRDSRELVCQLGDSAFALFDLNFLNATPPDLPLFALLRDRLAAFASTHLSPKDEVLVVDALASVAKASGRRFDALTASMYERRLALDGNANAHYDQGLFFKTRGRFREGMEANQRSHQLRKTPDEATLWNLGICATGAREGAIALDAWRALGIDCELGALGLPEGGFANTKVRLAQWPLAERNHDDPGLEETIWVERLGPCHGIIRSVLYSDLGVDFGDVVLFDGAPITTHTVDGRRVPVFPHLATLERRGYQRFSFVALQEAEGQVADLSQKLPGDSMVYVHSEQLQFFCRECWLKGEDSSHRHEKEGGARVTGKIAIAPGIEPRALLTLLDAAAHESNVVLWSPELSRAAGDPERAAREELQANALPARS